MKNNFWGLVYRKRTFEVSISRKNFLGPIYRKNFWASISKNNFFGISISKNNFLGSVYQQTLGSVYRKTTFWGSVYRQWSFFEMKDTCKRFPCFFCWFVPLIISLSASLHFRSLFILLYEPLALCYNAKITNIPLQLRIKCQVFKSHFFTNFIQFFCSFSICYESW